METFFYRWSGFQQFFDFTYFLTTLAFNLLKSDQSPGWSEISIVFLSNIQSGASSQAKIGGAYFSGVTGSIQDPIAVPGPCEVTEP